MTFQGVQVYLWLSALSENKEVPLWLRVHQAYLLSFKIKWNFSWNIHRFMWKTLHFRPIHVTHNSYEKEFSIVPFYIHHLPFYHHALIFTIFHHVFMSFFIPTRACVPSQFTTGLQVYPLQIKLYNWPQYCNIFF